ncbi:hypothetical protein N8I71_00015 [Roseibacterium sp. SDUM158016]|uniref:hypothetical protein n=1 Tax=Roseicyclus sediminis TaxID=2980997 RepID=UPI0021D217E6|nr:hypothetical protein [Roseibacterium sp. SDUM158016]MCU4651198.1 hypothetical protein [Roseibacterium sp. SDUM158016]
MRRALFAIGHVWTRLGLVTQTLLLVALTLWAMQLAAAEAERRFARHYLFETAMELEQAIVRALFLQYLPDLSAGEDPSADRLAAMDAALSPHFVAGHFDMVKLWSTDGRLIYWSHGRTASGHVADDALARALGGETVVALVEGEDASVPGTVFPGGDVYEIYVPLYNARGETVAIGEIYCRFDVLLGRVGEVARRMEQASFLALVAGLAALCALVGIAQVRISRSESSLARMRNSEMDLALRNRVLNRELDRLRHEWPRAGEYGVTRIRAELRDGPMQLLSLAALYTSQIVSRDSCRHQVRRARDLTSEALEALRGLISETTSPDQSAQGSFDVADRAIAEFEDQTGRTVTRNWTEARGICARVSPEAVAEVLLLVLCACDRHTSEDEIRVSAVRGAAGLQIVVECPLRWKGQGHAGAARAPSDEVMADLGRLRSETGRSGFDLDWSENTGRLRVVARLPGDPAT